MLQILWLRALTDLARGALDVAIASQPTAEMRVELAAAGVELPDAEELSALCKLKSLRSL